MKKPKIIALPGGLSACGYYRVLAPLAALERAGLAEVYRPEPTRLPSGKLDVQIDIRILENFDIAVLQRQSEERIADLIKTARKFGTKVVFDLDDDLYAVQPNTSAYEIFGRDWRKVGGLGKATGRAIPALPADVAPSAIPERRQHATLVHAAHQWTGQARGTMMQLLGNLRAADLVTVSTEQLRQVYSSQRADIVVLQNQIEPRDWEAAIASSYPKADGECWIGWAGSKSHWQDLKEAARAVTEVLRRNPHTRLVLIGFSEAVKLFEEVQEQVITFEWMPLESYRHVVAAFDIVLAPSADIRFNKGKSDIRVLEAALCGIPVVASETTYGDTVRAAGCGFVAKTVQKWQKGLARLVGDASLRSTLGQNGNEYVLRKRTYDANVRRWAEAYSSLF